MNEDTTYLIPFILDLLEIKQAVSIIPSYVPKKLLDQFVLYSNAGTYRLYIYVGGAWKYINML